MNREQVEKTIRDAFAGVQLGNGISVRHAEAIDSYYQGLSPDEINALDGSGVTDDWTS